MKKALIIALLLAITCTAAYAGIFSTITDWAFDNAINTILAGAFILISGFFGGTKIGKILTRSKLPIYQLKNVIVKVHDARRASSPGGVKMTREERDAIFKEVEELLSAIVVAFGKGK